MRQIPTKQSADVKLSVSSDSRFPFSPFPIGWYWVEFSENLKKERLYSKQWMGQQVIYWRDNKGQVCVSEATCPHLGANLSPELGGKLEDGLVVCPFHGYRYDVDGRCVRTLSGPSNTPVELKTFPTYESGGVVFAYWHPDGAEPTWGIPDLSIGDWSKFLYNSAVIRTHPQETSENGVDISHLPYVHGYEAVEILKPLVVEGPCLQNFFRINRRVGPSKLVSFTLDVDVTVTMRGLGFSMIEPVAQEAGIYVRQLALCTPIDEEHVNFVMAIQTKDIERPNVLIPGLSLLPRRLLNYWLRKIFFKIYMTDISQDFHIWENKKYLTYPRLGPAEQDILRFRRYCEQFHIID